MEQNTPKFHLRLNLFDGIVLLLALAVGGFLLWNSRSTASVPLASSATVRYTVRFLNWPEENVSRIREGGLLVDNVKKYEIAVWSPMRWSPPSPCCWTTRTANTSTRRTPDTWTSW